jgi:transcriptional regulator NrdR family protein
MTCPKCGNKLYVVDSVSSETTIICYRRRKCKHCKNIVYTKEVLCDETKAKIAFGIKANGGKNHE